MHCEACGRARDDETSTSCDCGAGSAAAIGEYEPPEVVRAGAGGSQPVTAVRLPPTAAGADTDAPATEVIREPFLRRPLKAPKRHPGFVTKLRTSPRGTGCPLCLSPEFADQYTPWHLAAAVLFFPFGVLSLLGPVRICRNGHRYGPGLGVVRGIQVFLVIAALVAGLVIWFLWSTIHTVVTQLGG